MARFIAGLTLAAIAAVGVTAEPSAAEPDSLPVFARPEFARSVAQGAQPLVVPAAGPAEPTAPVQPAAETKPVAEAKPITGTITEAPPKPAAPAASPAFPTTVPEAKARAAARMEPPATWSPQEIEIAKARCTQLLHGIDAVLIPEEPVREGECGTPAPVRVVSIGRKPEVTFSPPALVTCDMVVGLHAWLKSDLQPLARKHLGAEIVKIETMSDYSCRNAYGRVKTRLSEHGRANALDIRGFITSKSEAVAVLDNWGMTSREVIAQAAKEQAARQAMTPRPVVDPGRPSSPSQPAQPSQDVARGTIIDGLPRPTIAIPGVGNPSNSPTSMGFGLSRLGGPKPAQAGKIPEKTAPHAPAAAAPQASLPQAPLPDPRKTLFLRQAHASACRIFGTVLGPEANNAHRNHFHVDMAERTTGAFCE